MSESTAYEAYGNQATFRIDELMSIHDKLKCRNILSDMMYHAGANDPDALIRFERWRRSLCQSALNYAIRSKAVTPEPVFRRLLMLVLLASSPTSYECAAVIHAAYTWRIRGTISEDTFAGVMGGHWATLQFHAEFTTYATHVGLVLPNEHIDDIAIPLI